MYSVIALQKKTNTSDILPQPVDIKQIYNYYRVLESQTKDIALSKGHDSCAPSGQQVLSWIPSTTPIMMDNTSSVESASFAVIHLNASSFVEDAPEHPIKLQSNYQ